MTAEWKHKFSENLIWYSVVAATFNGPDAHYDLGAGGRSVTTDCHDAGFRSRGRFFKPALLDGDNAGGRVLRLAMEVLRVGLQR